MGACVCVYVCAFVSLHAFMVISSPQRVTMDVIVCLVCNLENQPISYYNIKETLCSTHQHILVTGWFVVACHVHCTIMFSMHPFMQFPAY